MPLRIELFPRRSGLEKIDTRGEVLQRQLCALVPGLARVTWVDVYSFEGDWDADRRQKAAAALGHPVSQKVFARLPSAPPESGYGEYTKDFDFAVEIGFLPGVTDNAGHTARQLVGDALGQALAAEAYASQLLLLAGVKSREEAQKIAGELANPLIQRVHIKDRAEFVKDNGMDIILPRVRIGEQGNVVASEVTLEVDDAELAAIGAAGVPDASCPGGRRGPLGLSLLSMQAIQAHFRKLGRNPTDIEIETFAQTWSEHCKHSIFASPIDEIKDGLYRHYIKRATQEIRKARGKDDICVSVFTDNAGAIVFDENWLITDKVETHNSPSALDPFGGAITGIVGVNRDAMGFGMGAKPVINRYGYCFADPREKIEYYRGRDKASPLLPPARIMEGVVHGVNVGGNCSGIPTPQGFAYFDACFSGKPLVFVGTVGLIPRTVNGKPSHEKGARAGDRIVMAGGRVGKDGIHGATFSSTALDQGSPVTAVQIGDPITQKKMSDALIKEARDKGLFRSITDNGAGGLSSSVGEMARDCGGAHVVLEVVPLKYPGLAPWEIWISESQERMTLAVPPEKTDELLALLKKRDVEATVIGEFTDNGLLHVTWQGQAVMRLSMDFLHDGMPMPPLATREVEVNESPAIIAGGGDPAATLARLVAQPNICSREFIVTQYDHEVQASSVLKPLQGAGRVCAEATVTRPVLDSRRGVVLAHGLVPRYSAIDTYHMAMNAIDIAVRHAVAAGAGMGHLALLDNFCWCSSYEPQRLYQLKRAAQACYDGAVAYGTPYISGKDSMFNDFRGFDVQGKPVNISILPTLLVSSIGVIDNINMSVSLDGKCAGDRLYLLGDTSDETGASEYMHLMGGSGGFLPRVDTARNLALYNRYHEAVRRGLVSSGIAVTLGGLGAALAKKTLGGRLGAEIDLQALAGLSDESVALYSESAGRILVSVAPAYVDEFEALFAGTACSYIGTLTDKPSLAVKGFGGREYLAVALAELEAAYRSTFSGY